MADLQAQIKRAILRSLYRASHGAEGNLTPLITALESFQDQGYKAMNGGMAIISTSGYGKSTTFQAPQIGQEITQGEVFSLSEEFISGYEAALVTLTTNGNTLPPEGPPGSNDLAIFNCMLASDGLQTITEIQKDYTMLRYPQISTGVGGA